MVEFEIPDKWISNTLKVGGVLIVLVMVATLIKPSITGNTVARVNQINANLTQCSSQLATTRDELETQRGLNNVLNEDIANATSMYTSCAAQLKESTDLATNKTRLADRLSSRYEYTLIELNETQVDYAELAEFAARAKCCVQNTLNDMDYDSYDIKSNAITCQDSNDGKFTLEC